MDTVLADHAPDIVMFDVPPPEGGLRGIDAYRDSWPAFFDWQASGAVFEITELDVTVGCAGPRTRPPAGSWRTSTTRSSTTTDRQAAAQSVASAQIGASARAARAAAMAGVAGITARPARTRRNAATTVGSNCVPMPARNSASATSSLIACR
jgi:hypothetical protein